MGWFGTSPDRVPDYVATMRAAYGDGGGGDHDRRLAARDDLSPNLFIAEIQMFVIQPLAVDETVQHVTAVQFKGAPDLNERHAAADDRLGRPGRASCWPTTPRCTSATSAACRRGTPSGC